LYGSDILAPHRARGLAGQAPEGAGQVALIVVAALLGEIGQAPPGGLGAQATAAENRCSD